MRKSIAIDMDEVLAEMLVKILSIYEEEYGEVLTREEYWGKGYQDLPKIMALRSHIFEKGFFRDLPVMADSQVVLQELNERFDLYIVTAAMTFRNSFEDKYDWLMEHFPFISKRNIVFCGDKHIIKTDWLIDDTPYNLKTFRVHLYFIRLHIIHKKSAFIESTTGKKSVNTLQTNKFI